jgi:hypothetical protein
LGQETVFEFDLESFGDVGIRDLEVGFSVEGVVDLVCVEELFQVGASLRLYNVLLVLLVVMVLVRLTKNLVRLAKLISIDPLVSDWS